MSYSGILKFLKTCTIAGAIQTVFATEGFCAEIKGEQLFDVFGFPVTNSMFTTWIFAAVIIVGVRLLLGRGAKLVPGRGQMAVEAVISSLSGIFEPLMGTKAFRAAFPLLLGFFWFILIMNWSGLLPGVGSIGQERAAETAGGAAHFVPFLRPANTDLNTTLALAIISFVAWIIFVLKYAGLKVFLHDTFGNKADKSDTPVLIYYLLFPIFFAVGFVEIISAAIRPVSLSCRLFGNVFGGEMLLESMYGMFAYILPLPFCFLELLVGLVQAFIFTLLTAVYIGLLTSHEDAHHEAKPQ